jgi:hypothetical protein
MDDSFIKMQEKIFNILTKSDDSFYRKVIHLINEKNHQELEDLIKKEKQDLDSPRDALINFLSYALKKHDFKAIQILVNNGANVNFRNDNEYPIIDSIHLSEKEVLLFLFENGLDLNNKAGEMALFGTLCDDYIENAKLFFLHGAPYQNIEWDCDEIKPHIKEYFLSFIEKTQLDKMIPLNENKINKIKV